jgi:hypothetical protein
MARGNVKKEEKMKLFQVVPGCSEDVPGNRLVMLFPDTLSLSVGERVSGEQLKRDGKNSVKPEVVPGTGRWCDGVWIEPEYMPGQITTEKPDWVTPPDDVTERWHQRRVERDRAKRGTK